MKKVIISILGIIFLTTITACSITDAVNIFGLTYIQAVALNSAITSTTTSTDAPIPEQAVQRYEGIPQGTSPEGFPQLGDPQAVAQVLGYMSFSCPHCGNFHANVFDGLLDRIRKGNVLYTYVPLYNTGNIPNGFEANVAALCVAEQGLFWPYQDALYNWQTQFGSDAFSSDRLRQGAGNLDVDLARWDACLGKPEIQDTLNAALRMEANVLGTPSISVNGVLLESTDLKTINRAIDQVLGGNT